MQRIVILGNAKKINLSRFPRLSSSNSRARPNIRHLVNTHCSESRLRKFGQLIGNGFAQGIHHDPGARRKRPPL